MSKNCSQCAFCIVEMTGYSEYTITGTIYTCLGELNLKFPIDTEDCNPQQEAEAMAIADECPAYREGQSRGIGLGVDDAKQEFREWVAQLLPPAAGSEQGEKK